MNQCNKRKQIFFFSVATPEKQLFDIYTKKPQRDKCKNHLQKQYVTTQRTLNIS